MLDYLRQRSQSAIIIFFVAIISAVFIINFGPQSQGCGSEGTVWLAEVYGRTLTLGDFRWVERLIRNRYRLPRDYVESPRFVQDVIDGLIQREVLFHAATEAGLAVGDEDVRRAVVDRGLIYFSWGTDSPLPLRGPMRYNFRDDDGHFDEEGFRENFLRSAQLSEKAFTEQQIRELMAERMRQLEESSVQISEDELWAEYSRFADRVNLQYVRIYPAFFRQSLNPTDAELDSWARDHSEEIERQYEADRFRYRNVRKQIRVLDIMIRLSEDAEDDEIAAQRQRAEAVLALAKSPDADFRQLARCFSDDPQGVSRSGDLGFLRKGMSRFGSEFDDAVFELEPGAFSDVITTKRGLHVVKVLEAREGDIELEQARLEIAEKLFREQRGDARAQELSESILTKARAGATVDDSILEGISELEPEQCPLLTAETPPEPGEEPPEGAEEEPQRRRPLQPVVRETGFFNRSALGVPGVGDSSRLMTVAFELTADVPVAEEVVQVGDDLFIVRLAEEGRQPPTREEFDGEHESYLGRLLNRKRRDALTIFIQGLMRQAETDNAIERNEPAIRRLSRTPEDESDEAAADDQGAGDQGAGESREEESNDE
jgi:parvulin-like peptidyl-prolyl isomerase